MDERRFEELLKKRGEVGLSHDEANELGRMFAERQGKPYANADRRPGTGSEESGAREEGAPPPREAAPVPAEEVGERGEVPPSH